MIIILGSVFIFIVGLILMIVFDYDRRDSEVLFNIGTALLVSSILTLVVAGILAIGLHISAPIDNVENISEYQSILTNKEIVETGEDVTLLTKTTVNTSIYEWNLKLDKHKYWNDSPFTNWLEPDDIYDGCDYIDPIQ